MSNNRPIHSIQAVSRRTGLTPDVIRAWERRYGAVAPSRTSTRRRLFTDEDVSRLLLLRRATLAGRRISEVAQLPLDQLSGLVAEDEAAAARAPRGENRPRASSRTDQALEAIRHLDAEGLEIILRKAARELGLNDLLDDVLVPVLERVGQEWREGNLRIHQEHMSTAVVRSLLDAMRTAQTLAFPGPGLIVSTPSGEHHELGAMMAALVASADGWRVTYLGPDTPAEELVAAAARAKARAIALSLVYPEQEEIVAELRRLRELLPGGLPILLGGRGAKVLRATLGHGGFEFLESNDELSEVLGRIRRSL